MTGRLVPLLACVFGAACSGTGEVRVPIDGGAAGSSGNSSCSNDGQCVPGACVAGRCVDRVTSFSVPLAAEISPPTIGPQAALTEKTGITTSSDWKTLRTDASALVQDGFYAAPPAVFPSNASVLLNVPSLIPGRPDLTFQTTIVPGSIAVTIMAPTMLGGRAGTLNVVPLPPADQTSPPYQFTVTDVLAPMVIEILSTNRTPHGALIDALGKPRTAYSARAFLDATLVSNVAAMKTDGTFALFVPTAITDEVTVELAPVKGTDPWFTFTPMALTGSNQNLGTVTLPTYQVPQPVTFAVRDKDTNAPIVGAAVRAITVLDADPSIPSPPGTTRYWQSGTTGANGSTSLALIPGVNRTPRLYDVAIVPSPGSPYASTCVQQQPILGGGETASITVALRPVVSGTVISAQESPVGGVTVTASRLAEVAKVCSATGPTAFTTTTDASGVYRLPVDLGTYQIDFVPPSGSAAPRLSKYNFVVDSDKPHVVVQLPQPYLIEGDVVDASSMPLPNATIRFFEPLCEKVENCTLLPILRAETQSDNAGHFRAIVALPDRTN